MSCCGCAGIFNSPVAVELITELFEENNSLDKLESFISTNGCECYNLPYNEEKIEIKKLSWEVPEKYDNVVPMYAGKNLGVKPFGIRAMNCMRLEKSYKLIGTEMSIEYSPFESGLDRFIKMDKF